MLFNVTRYAERNDPLLTKVIAATGGSEHDLPWPLPNLKPTTEARFWGWRSTYSFPAEIWLGQKKVEVEGKERYANIMVYWVGHSQFIGGGFAVACFRQHSEQDVRYFEWRACEHDFKQRNIGNCLNRYTCTKCGEAFDIDSSG